MEDPDYRAFARDMMRLCKKHGVRMHAYYLGDVGLGPASAKTTGQFCYADFKFSPEEAIMGHGAEMTRMTRGG